MKNPTCPTCSEPVSEVNQLPTGTQLLPCGHTVTGDEYKSWRNKTVHLPEDIAAREAVDRGETTPSLEHRLHDLLAYFRGKGDEDSAYRDAGDRLGRILIESRDQR